MKKREKLTFVIQGNFYTFHRCVTSKIKAKVLTGTYVCTMSIKSQAQKQKNALIAIKVVMSER